MEKIYNFLVSSKTTLILMLMLAFSIAFATFAEDKYDTETAKLWIYNAKWMEVLIVFLTVNLIGAILIKEMYQISKLGSLMVHTGFIVMVIGAGISRYTGYEGSMHIREGSSSNVIFSSEIYLQVLNPKTNEIKDFKITMNLNGLKPFNISYDLNGEQIELAYDSYIRNAAKTYVENSPGGKDVIRLQVGMNDSFVDDYISEGETKNIGGLRFDFSNSQEKELIKIKKEGADYIISGFDDIYISKPNNEQQDSVLENKTGLFKCRQIYKTADILILPISFYNKAVMKTVSADMSTNYPDAIIARLKYKGQEQTLEIFGGNGYVSEFQNYKVGDDNIKIAYGNKLIELAFSIYLKDFILERYPGSDRPSSYESEVVLIDTKADYKKDYKIYMNNILDYGGFRFFQSSYDPDESGTILSVSHDKAGTLVTYISYVLLTLGFIINFFNKKSRFGLLRQRIKKAGIERKKAGILTIILMLLSFSSFSQNSQNAVSKEHADKFAHLIIQTVEGRFQPIHTFANDVIHKIYKRNSIRIEGKGNLSGTQLYMDLIIDSEFWKSQKIIYVKNPIIRNIIGISENYASFNDFFNQQDQYKLAEFTEKAFKKGKAEKSKFDKEVLKVDEQLNILYMTFRGSMLKIFPVQFSDNHEWVSIDNQKAYQPLQGSINAINEDLKLNVFTYSNIFRIYLEELKKATISGKYERAEQILGYIATIQRQVGSPEILPSETKINLEIHYNEARIFILLKYFYMILSVILLVLSFINHLKVTKSKILTGLQNLFIILLAAAFLYHTYGLTLRWYLSGHAPWSNGYEALIFVAWGGLLAGFIFMRHSKITLAATALLAFFIMLTTGFSNYDPQLTNLQPVLKSYWLIIHVAVIVISYGFLGLGFVLGLMNLVIYLFKNESNAKSLDITIKDLTNINEINLIIGVALATVGTFLGAVWANESWGRYWGWDAKETWALIILFVYAVVLHLRLVPKLNNGLVFNIGSVIGFGSVIMTFFGVNFYFSKGLHTYASGSKSAIPIWLVVLLVIIIFIIIGAYNKEKKYGNTASEE